MFILSFDNQGSKGNQRTLYRVRNRGKSNAIFYTSLAFCYSNTSYKFDSAY